MSTNTSTSPPEISADELRSMLADGRPVQVLDVRPRDEFDDWRIPGSRHVGGYRALKQGADGLYADLEFSDDAPVVTVCGAGRTSREAARQLRDRGLEAYSLHGGMRGWTFAWNVATRSFSEADVVQVRRTGKGCLSYLIGTGDEALVIDPSLSPEIYQKQAAERGWTITGVTDTHIHADHLSRARQLAESANVTLFLPAQERAGFDYEPLADGDVLDVGGAPVTALRTPGHTPESTTFRLGDDALFTGDTLFPTGVGRPDLDADRDEGRRKARELYRSLQRLMGLPSDLMVLPGHASEPVPFDGEVVGAPLRTVQSDVDAVDWSEEEFVDAILDRVPPTPPNHEAIIADNERGVWAEDTDVVDLEAGANRCAVS